MATQTIPCNIPEATLKMVAEAADKHCEEKGYEVIPFAGQSFFWPRMNE
jgi:hypothetical protein